MSYPKPFVAPDLSLPDPGDRWDSRFGGPTPWQQNISQWAQLGNPVPERPFEGLGKFDITESLPFTGEVPLTRLAAPQRLPPPQPGVFETLGRGIPGMFAQFVPNGDFQNAVGNIGGFLGSLPDGLIRVIPSQEFLSGGMNVEEVFNALPEDREKREYESYIAADQSNAMRYMSQYMDSRQTEVARALGVSTLDAGTFQPSVDFSEQLRRLVFNGALSALGNRTARGFVGSIRDVDGTILNADPETLNPELKELRTRYDKGTISKDELMDELSVGRYRWTNDDSMYGAAISLVMDVVSDPLTWFTFGIGGAAKSLATGALGVARNGVAGSVTRAGLRDAAIDATRGAMSRADWLKTTTSDGINEALYSYAKNTRPDLVEQGMQGMSTWQRSLVAAEPIIRPAAAVANQIDSMFGWFGTGPLAKQLGSKVVNGRMQGFAAYYGANRLKGMQDFYGDKFDDFRIHLGIAGSNVNLSLQQRNMARGAMGADPNFRGTKFTPDEVAAARLSADEHFPIEAQRETARTDEHMLPAGQGEAAYQRARTDNINTLAPDLATATGKTVAEATDFLNKQDRKGLALAHRMVYAYTVKNLNEAKRGALNQITHDLQVATAAGDTALMAKLQADFKAMQHYTLVSERALTFQRAQALLAAITPTTDAARTAARDAVDAYDTLGHSYLDGKFSPEELRQRMVEHITELMADPDNRLIRTLDPTKVHADVQRAMGGSKYEVGLSPLDRWGISKGADGVVRGVNTFVDAVDDVMPNDVVRPWGRRDIWKERFLGQIHGARLYYEAEAKFKEYGVRQYGMSAQEGQRLFRGIHKAANDMGIGPRGLSPDDVIRVADEVQLEPAMRARTGPGSLMELTLRAFEGDLATVGFAPKVSGKMKTASGRLGNWLGLISERYYGALRFYLSPIFTMMESVEGPFFMLLRGIKPGMRWTSRDLRMMAILDHMRGAGERYTDQLERAQSATIDMDMAMRLSKAIDGNAPGGWKRLLPTKWHKTNPLEAGIRTSGVWDFKKLQYIRHEGKAASENWANWMDRNQPELLAKWKAEMGTGSIEDLYMRAMEERGGFTDNNRHIIHMMDAVKPANLGKRERIRMGDVAKFHGYRTTAEMYTDIRNNNLTQAAFTQRYTNLNVPPAYADRIWQVANGPSIVEWRSGVEVAFEGNTVATNTFMDFHHWMARKQGMSFEEWMNTEYGGVPQLVASARSIPRGAFFQQTVEESLRKAGMEYHPKGTPKFDAALAETKRLAPVVPTPEVKGKTRVVKDEQGNVISGGVDKYENIQLEKARAGREAVDANPEAVMPAQHVGRSADDMYDKVTADTLNGFGGNWDDINSALDWYDEVLSVFVGVADGLPVETIRGLSEAWAEKGAGALTDEQARASLAARMQVAFAGSQQRSSVLSGMRSMLAAIDAAAYQRGPGAKGLGIVVERINALLLEYKNLPAEAVGLKLSDFFDSLAGNTTRSITSSIGDTLQPAAMDIHMRRAWGYGDSAYLAKSAQALLRSRGLKATPELLDAAEREIAAARKWDLEEARARSNDAPSDAEYEWMLRSTNALMDRWNKDGTIKKKVTAEDGTVSYVPRTDLTAAQVQALLWVGVKRSMEDIEVPPTTLLRQSGIQVAVETVPGRGSHLARWMPDSDSILELDAGGDPRHAADLMSTITHDITRQIVPIINKEVGSLHLSTTDASGRWTPFDGTPTTFAPNATVEWAGSVLQNEMAARMQAHLQEQEAVYVLHPWAEAALATTRDKPFVRSDATSNRLWSQDLAFSPDMPKHEVQAYLEPLTKWYELAMKRANMGADQFPGSMVGTLDDGSLAVRHSWNQEANPHLIARWERVKAEADRLEAIPASKRTAEDKAALAAARKERDFHGTQEDVPTLDDEGNPVLDKKTGEPKTHKEWVRGTDKATLADMQEFTRLHPDDLARLEDGTWINDIGTGYAPMPVRVTQNPVMARLLDGDHGAALEGMGVDVAALDGRHKETVRGIYLDAYGRHAPASTGIAFERQRILDPDAPYFQRDPSGNVRGAFAPAAAGHAASTYFVANRTDPTSAIHESFHLFARHLHPSSRDAFVRAYNDAHGLTGTRGAKRVLTHDVEEWMAAEFEAFAAGDYARAGEFGQTFKAYAEWAQQHGSARTKAGSAASGVFEQVLRDWGDIPSGVYDLEQERMYEGGRIATLRGEDEAHTTSYYKHSRNFIERSLNHPYLGLYPISYMWGKVLPELTRFLVRRPFGLKAPLGGLIAANHVWTNVQMQLQVDEELRKWIDEHPESIRLLQMMTPGTPWELPVNFPAFGRHFAERQAENALLEAQGLAPKPFDMGKAVSDTLGYAIGYASLAERAGKIGDEFGGILGDIGGGLNQLPGAAGGALDSFTGESDAGY